MFSPKKNIIKKENEIELGLNEIPNEYGWFGLTHKCCIELNYTPEQVDDLNYIYFLNWLSYFYYKNEILKK